MAASVNKVCRSSVIGKRKKPNFLRQTKKSTRLDACNLQRWWEAREKKRQDVERMEEPISKQSRQNQQEKEEKDLEENSQKFCMLCVVLCILLLVWCRSSPVLSRSHVFQSTLLHVFNVNIMRRQFVKSTLNRWLILCLWSGPLIETTAAFN